MRHAALVALLFAGGCADEPEGCPDGPSRPYVVEEDGRLAVYTGCDVHREIMEAGAFEPDLEDDFTLIEVPSKLAPTVDDPTTVRLCDPDLAIRVEFHDTHCTIAPSRFNPILTMREGDACVVHGESGQPGVSGIVQLRWEDDALWAWVGFQADLYFPTEDGGIEGLSYGRGATPTDLEDPDLEDPDVRELCPCSDPDVCEPPEGF